MNTASTNFSGFFTIDSQTRATRIAWLVSIPVCLGVLSLGVYKALDFIHNRGKGQAPDGMEILLFILFFLLLPAGYALVGLMKMFQRPGVYFRGIRTTDSGFEAGSLTIDLGSIEPQNTWQHSCSGKILAGKWQSEKVVTGEHLSVVIFVKEDRNSKQHYFFERLVIVSQDSVLYQFTGAKSIAESNCNDIVVMLDGSFQLLGGLGAVPCQSLLEPLERAADVLSAAFPSKPPACTLNFVAKTVSLDKVMLFGFVGGLVKAAIDTKRKGELQASFRACQLFDSDFTQKLSDFAERRGWTITAGGK